MNGESATRIGDGERWARTIVSVVIALGAGWVAGGMARKPGTVQDFAYYWRAARLFVGGVDPYTVALHSRAWPLPDPFFYPFPAALATWPLHALAQPVAVAIFVGLPAGLLAWRLSRDALWPLCALASPSFVMAVVLGQWSPWLLLGLLTPAAAWAFACKPSLGLACLVARPSWRAIAACAAIGVASLVVFPTWPAGWLHTLRSLDGHAPPILTPAGAVLALAALRWRRSDARLVLAMACVPQLLLFADQLPLSLVAKSRREAVMMLLASWICALLWFARDANHEASVWFAEPYALVGCYLPALYLVLRRPAEARAQRERADRLAPVRPSYAPPLTAGPLGSGRRSE